MGSELERRPEQPELFSGIPKEAQQITRRRFFARLGLGSLTLVLGTVTAWGVGLFYPSITFESSPIFSAGQPSDFQIGDIGDMGDQRVFVFRAELGFQAISNVCTHLGCKPKWSSTRLRFECPCHGSVFARDGSVINGPAPLPLPFFLMTLAVDGRLLVDKSIDKGSYWKGIDHNIYLTPDGRHINDQGEPVDI
ncbi:MAG: ubiquinol-cytochrome c reductase iron-sulfur subunit [Candidatus Bipolaricaulia bacterium]